MKFHIFTFLTLTLIFFGCSKDEPRLQLTDFNKPIVEGYYEIDEAGNWTGNTYGIPNVKLYNGASEEKSDFRILCFPNPSYSMVQLGIRVSSNELPINVWITEADYLQAPTNSVISHGMVSITVGGTPVAQVLVLPEDYDETDVLATVPLEPDTVKSIYAQTKAITSVRYTGYSLYIVLDVSSLKEGFYRLYVEQGGELLYDNLYITDNYEYYRNEY
jgi:hypothetical protein